MKPFNPVGMLVVLTLLEGLSAFGRTSALSPFLPSLCSDLSLSITQISGAYMLANLTAGLLLPFVGKFYNRTGLSHFVKAFVIIFGTSFILIGILHVQPMRVWHWYPLAVLGCAFIGIRTAVQAYTLAGRSWLATHFSQRRGFATGCVQLCVTMVTASTPVICYNISRHWTWGMFFGTLGTGWLIGLLICPFLSDEKPSKASNSVPTQRSFGDHRALFVFIWIILFFRNAQNSGIAFHLVPMCLDFGVNPKTVSAAFMPISLLAVGMTFLFGHCFKRVGSRTVLGLFLLSDAGMLHAVKHIDADGMLGLFIACTGIYWGVNNIIASMVIPALFGVRRIGALNGFAFGAVSLGSAIGPFYFGVMKDAISYQSALTLCIGGVWLLLCLFAFLQSRIKSAEVEA